MENTVLDCIRDRRSTRSYLPDQISPEQLDALLNAAIWAPSGGNNQSWLFTAIQNREILDELNKIVRTAFQTYIPDDDYPSKHSIKTASQKEGFNFFYRAPTLIIASNKPNYENAMADCSLALENIFLAAQSMGLGSCYINHLHWLRYDENVRNFLFDLGIPREHTICSSAAVGFIDRPTPAPARKPNTTQIVK